MPFRTGRPISSIGRSRKARLAEIVVRGIYDSSIQELAKGIDASIGLQQIPGPAPHVAEGFTATGLPLRQVLDTLVTIDPRYEWRVVDDVVVDREGTYAKRAGLESQARLSCVYAL